MGASVAFTYIHCKPHIAVNDRSVLLDSIAAVKPPGSTVEVARPLAGQAESPEAVYVARDAEENAVGYIAQGSAQGYSSVVRVMVGLRAKDMAIVKVVVLSQLETPGLGANVEATKSNYTLWDKLFGSKDPERLFNPFLDRFDSKPGRQVDDIQGMTAATITSDATKAAVRQAIQRIEKAVGRAAAEN
jgi:RnfABCDGE-type electron transport complex G subunit